MTELPNLDTLTHEQTLDMVAEAMRDPDIREAVGASDGHLMAVLRVVELQDLKIHDEALSEISRVCADRRRVMAHCAELAAKLEQAETQSRKDGYEIAGLRMRVEMHERIASGALQCCGSIPRRITLDDVATAVGERLATELVLERERHAKTQAQLEMALLRLTEANHAAPNWSHAEALQQRDAILQSDVAGRARIRALETALREACSIGQPARDRKVDPRWEAPHTCEMLRMFTTGMTLDQLHAKWAGLRALADGGRETPTDAPDVDVVDEFDLGQDQPTPAVEMVTMEETMRMRKP